MHNCPP